MGAIIKQMDKNKCWQGCREMRTLIECFWECNTVQLLQKIV